MRTSNRGRVNSRTGPAGRSNRTNRKNKKNNGCNVFAFFAIIILAILIILLFRSCGASFNKSLRGLNENLTKQQYPIKYQNLVEKYSKKYDLDKYLVYAVIKTESKFDQYAVSQAGAYGLMQLQSETASDCARKLKIDVDLPDDLYEPDINIHLGTYYLSWLLDKYDDDIVLAVAAYNGGIGNVDSWLNDSRYSDGSGGLKNIPFGETANYVTGVTASYEKYKEIYK